LDTAEKAAKQFIRHLLSFLLFIYFYCTDPMKEEKGLERTKNLNGDNKKNNIKV
jgi:hypothetical protein